VILITAENQAERNLTRVGTEHVLNSFGGGGGLGWILLKPAWSRSYETIGGLFFFFRGGTLEKELFKLRKEGEICCSSLVTGKDGLRRGDCRGGKSFLSVGGRGKTHHKSLSPDFEEALEAKKGVQQKLVGRNLSRFGNGN